MIVRELYRRARLGGMKGRTLRCIFGRPDPIGSVCTHAFKTEQTFRRLQPRESARFTRGFPDRAQAWATASGGRMRARSRAN